MTDSANTFELAWRWTNPSHNVLPPEVMAQIVLLEEATVPSCLTVRDQLDRAQSRTFDRQAPVKLTMLGAGSANYPSARLRQSWSAGDRD